MHNVLAAKRGMVSQVAIPEFATDINGDKRGAADNSPRTLPLPGPTLFN